MKEMIRQAQLMQRKMQEAQEALKTKTVEASAGGGMVNIVCTGGQEFLSVKIDPSVVEAGDVEMLQDLIMAAANDALNKSRAMVEQEMGKITGGIKLPGLM